MGCTHSGFRTIRSRYDREQGTLVYLWVCERCDKVLDEAGREEYRPRYDPHGNDRYMTLSPQPAA